MTRWLASATYGFKGARPKADGRKPANPSVFAASSGFAATGRELKNVEHVQGEPQQGQAGKGAQKPAFFAHPPSDLRLLVTPATVVVIIQAR